MKLVIQTLKHDGSVLAFQDVLSKDIDESAGRHYNVRQHVEDAITLARNLLAAPDFDSKPKRVKSSPLDNLLASD